MSGVVVSRTDLITFNRSFLNIYCFYEVIQAYWIFTIGASPCTFLTCFVGF